MTTAGAGRMPPTSWHVAGSYFEACNCEAVCPCRSRGGREGGRSTYGVCDFALSWRVIDGVADGIDLSDLGVVMAGSYVDDEPGSPWTVALYVDERSTDEQKDALADIFLGRAGGTTLSNFAGAIHSVSAVRRAAIELDHREGSRRARAGSYVEIVEAAPFPHEDTVACGIPGFDHPGQELTMDVMQVDDAPLQWSVRGKCGFATDFAYTSDR